MKYFLVLFVTFYSTFTNCQIVLSCCNDPLATPVTDLVLNKLVSNAAPTIGSNVVFTVIVENLSGVSADDVSVVDVLPLGYTFVSYVADVGTTYAYPTWTLNTLASGQSKTLNITATVNPTGPYQNSATVTTSTTETIIINNMDVVDVLPTPPVMLGSICGNIFDDVNGDGIKTGDPIIDGAQLNLFRQGGAYMATTYSNYNGDYCFNALTSETYYVTVVVPYMYDGITYPLLGGDSNIDSDGTTVIPVGGIGNPNATRIVNGDHYVNVDFGFYKESCIEGLFLIDQVADCVVTHSGDLSLNGLDITAYYFNVPLATYLPYATTSTTTWLFPLGHPLHLGSNHNGHFRVCVRPGLIKLVITTSIPYTTPLDPSCYNNGSDEMLDFDNTLHTEIPPFQLNGGQTTLNYSFGIKPL